MTFKYSICHPEKEAIEYKNTPILGQEVLEIAKNHPWIAELQLVNTLPTEKVCYSPSLDFTNLQNNLSFCLTASFDKKGALEFSLWYNRPKKVKIFFGLLGEKERMVVDDFWSLNFEASLTYLKHFVDGNYATIEKLYRK